MVECSGWPMRTLDGRDGAAVDLVGLDPGAVLQMPGEHVSK